MVRTKILPILAGLFMFSALVVSAQQNSANLTEQRVPLIVNRRIETLDPARRWRNFDAFELALNLAAATA